ncbi:MAG: hypothetical protein IJ862_01740 [Selenomonadaceae bacterium]|nr:hypothetical protein [Selenomonadaceae bacterium]
MREVFFLLLILSIITVMGCVTAFMLANLIKLNIPTKKVIRVAIGSVILFVISTVLLVVTK